MSELAAVLRAWRDRVQPGAVGLPAAPDRRAPGLRREDLAALAGLSVDYVVRLEQGRSTHPSPQVLAALARALRLDEAERDHLYRVAGVAAPAHGLVPRHVTPGIHRIVDRLGDAGVAVYSASWDRLMCNALWAAMSGGEQHVGRDANVAWRHFILRLGLGDAGIVEFDDEHADAFSRDLVADLRGARGRYPHDPELAALVSDLRERSPAFERLWGSGTIAEHRESRKTIHSSAIGPITVDCDVLNAPTSDMHIVVYTAEPGSTDAAALDLLRVTGTQDLSPLP